VTRERKVCTIENKKGTSERDSTVESTVYIRAHTLSIRSIHCDCLYRSEIKDKNESFFFFLKEPKKEQVQYLNQRA